MDNKDKEALLSYVKVTHVCFIIINNSALENNKLFLYTIKAERDKYELYPSRAFV